MHSIARRVLREVASRSHLTRSISTLYDFPIRIFSNHFALAERIEVATPNLYLLAMAAGAGETSFGNAGLRFRVHKMLSTPVMEVGESFKACGQPLCLPQIKREHIGDAVHPGSNMTICVLLPRRHVISARPCSTIGECACHYSSPYRTAAHGADGARRTPRYDQGIPCGSSRSAALRRRFATVNAETSGGLECRSIERGG